MTDTPSYDVITIGGGPAGLSGAILLARSRRSVLVLDAGEPRNAPAHAMHNFLSRDGISPGDLLTHGRDELRAYGGKLWSARVASATRVEDGSFHVVLEDGRGVDARRLLITTGLIDELPEIPGVRERWGRDVLHCPYCHGWEVRDHSIGVLATGPGGVHIALLFRQLTSDVVYFAHTAPALTSEQSAQFAARGIRVVHERVASLVIREDRLEGVQLVNGADVPCQAVVVTPRFVARSDVLASLGLQPTEHPLGFGEAIAADSSGRTEVQGVWVAGNVTDLSAGVIASAAAGTGVAAQINADLVAEDTQRALRSASADVLSPGFWDGRYAEADQIWSGSPNPQLVAYIQHEKPSTALDVGCGEGADAIWLAKRGWHVIAMDVSQLALERARAAGSTAGTEVANRITWLYQDVLTWNDAGSRFDLVSAQYLHFTRDNAALHRRLAALVRPGGSLLVVGHHPSLVHADRHHDTPFDPKDLLFEPETVAAALDPAEWQVQLCAVVERQPSSAHRQAGVMKDSVLLARRTTSLRRGSVDQRAPGALLGARESGPVSVPIQSPS